MTSHISEARRTAIHSELDRLLDILERLRSPEGCPWDRAQTRGDIAAYLMDEACEVIDAIHEGSSDDLKEELGDLLFQILFLARMAEEDGLYDVGDVMAAIAEKMIRRHPHVFGTVSANTIEDIRENWEAIKRREKGDRDKNQSVLQGVPRSLPALNRAMKITKKAARAGFDWPSIDGVIDKVIEEMQELQQSISEENREGVEEELGDLFFSLVNLCRHADVDPDRALRKSTEKFTRRFLFMERAVSREGQPLESATMDEMDRLWELCKKVSKTGDTS